MKTLILKSEEICNPLKGDWIHARIVEGECFVPMDEVHVYSEFKPKQFDYRYRARVLLSHLEPLPGTAKAKGSWFERVHAAIDRMLSGKSATENCKLKTENYSWHLLLEPIEDRPPIAPREKWLLGRHGSWCSITVPGTGDQRIYCLRTESLFLRLADENLDLEADEI